MIGLSAAVAAAAGGLTLTTAASAFAATGGFNSYVEVKQVSATNASCSTQLLSTQVSKQGPAYVSAFVVSNHETRRSCAGWLETWNRRTGWRQAGGRVTLAPFGLSVR